MKTEQLIDMLNTNVEPVDRRLFARKLRIALAAGSLVALVAALLILGVRPDLKSADALGFLLFKLAFAVSVVGVASLYLMKVVRPGGEQKTHSLLVLAPFGIIAVLAALSLGNAPSSHWRTMVVGDMWLECLLSIPIIATLPFAVIVWSVRRFATPTDLTRTGAFVGLVAGGVSAMGYALHCMDDSLPFVALWYGGTIALCTLAGALLGPRLLRW